MSNEPTVLHVVEAVEGGTIRHVADLVSHVRGLSHIVAAPTRRSTGLTDAQAMDTIAQQSRLISLPMTRNPMTLRNLLAVARLRRLVESERVDVVHAHSTVGGLVARAIDLPVPVIYTPNALQPMALVQRLERFLARRTSAFVAVSASEHADVLARRLIPPGRLFTIPNGIAPHTHQATLDLRAHLGLPASTPLFGTVIRLVRQKEPEDFVNAAGRVLAAHLEAHAVLIGDGPLRPRVERAATRTTHADRLHVLGYVPEAATVLPQLDVFVLASRFEGMPYALMEAMQAGVAVVATDVGGNRDAVAHDATGLLVSAGDPGAIAAAVSRLMEDGELRSRLGAAAAAVVAERFSLEAMAGAHEAFYTSVIRQGDRP